MSVKIAGNTSNIDLEVDAASRAGRATGYDTLGRELLPPVNPLNGGSYLAPFEVRHTGAPAAGVTVVAMRGPPTLTAYIRRIRGIVGFDGVALAASGTLRYGLYRGAGVVSATGGTVRGQCKKRTASQPSSIVDYRVDLAGAGLTTTGITWETDPFFVIPLPVVSVQVAAPATSGSAGAFTPFDLNFNIAGVDGFFELGANEHLGIRVQTVAAIIGLTIAGGIEWDER